MVAVWAADRERLADSQVLNVAWNWEENKLGRLADHWLFSLNVKYILRRKTTKAVSHPLSN